MKRLVSLAVPILAAVFAAAAHAEQKPLRVAVLVPYVQDALGRVTGPFEVVAAVRVSLHAPAPGGVADLGSPHSPSYERLVEARPDLIVGDRMIHSAQADKLEAGGAELMLLDSSSVEATLAGLDQLARRVGAGDAMARQTAETRAQLARLELGQPLATLALFGAPGSFMVLTDRTWIGDLLRMQGFEVLGADGAGSERFPGMLAVSDEQLATLRPELVLLVAHGDPNAIRGAFEKRMADGGPWRGVRESATRGVHVLPPNLFASNPGLGLPNAAQALAALARPSAPGAPAR
jgi:iron complex transport system substrate-binding protein